MVKVAFLALCTLALVGILEWAVAGYSGNESRQRIEALIPGGVTTLTAAWAIATLWAVVSWFRVPSSPIPGLVILGLYVLLLLYLDQWARRVAVPTNGGISPSEVWLYLAGGIGVAYAFGVALSIGVAAGVVWRLRGR
jgi:hypothetical protein